MAFRRSGLVSFVAIVLLCRPAAGLEAITRDVAVTRMLADSHGHKFAITFKPPAGRELDPRILNAFEISVSSGAAAVGAPVAQNADGILLAESEEDPIDVSGYTIHVEAVTLAGCRSEVRIAKSRPGVLKKLYRFIISASGPSSMSLVAFPTKGNVNIEIKADGHCVSSGKPENTLDVATCTLPACNDPEFGTYVSGEITNPRPYNVKFVGVATFVFVN